ncbi:MAG: DUF4465 domain-containing protein [Flavobacteriales bacterium]|nr:DUF4465 domain-containing protein [Flavobacteriales bacterium]
MKHLLFLLSIGLATSAVAQFGSTLTFESYDLDLDTFLNGQDTNVLNEECFHWECEYDTSFGGYWASGVAVSTMRDDSTGQFTNLYSSKAGSGRQSESYGVVSASTETFLNVSENCYGWEAGIRWMGGYVSNASYTYYSMLNGDQFAKKFGGAAGDDPDYLFIRFNFYDYMGGENNSAADSHFDFYLADFRFEDNSQDYILDDWTFVELNDFPAYEHGGHRVSMQLFSSDTGAFGINTPAYFCLDDLMFSYASGLISERDASSIQIAVKDDSFEITSEMRSSAVLISLDGNILTSSKDDTHHTLPTASLPQGVYIVQITSGDAVTSQKVFRW